ncbi:MAG TPA: ion channel [Thermodesulfovibrionales bacterium]|nr:ion channel [Thermodesulfovibrionales bacterium]
MGPQSYDRPQSLFKKSLSAIKGRCHFLLLSLITVLLIYHRATARPYLALILQTLILITGVYAVSDSKRRLIAAVGIGTLQFFVSALTLSVPSLDLVIPAEIIIVVFYGFTLITVLEYVVRGESVTTDKIFGAISVYLLIGFAWASLYHLVYAHEPSAFSVSAKGVPDFVYFSFVTLCTVGYGDITPASGFARSLVILEAVTGVLYLAVLVSRLINLYRSDSCRGQK